MPTFHLQVPARVTKADIEALQAGLEPYGEVYEVPSPSLDLEWIALALSLVFEAVQAADVLANWLQRTPGANRAVIRFADGRTIRLEDTDPEAFRKALRSALN
jgi:hypothetical protein